MSGLLERAIEDWLIRTDERSYQLPYVTLLARQGHRVKMVSRHGPGEHGKDIVTVSRQGEVCGFQLKAGDIGTAEWRTIDSEVRECASVPVSIPGLAHRVPARAFVVLTGQVSDPVREKLALINHDNAQKGWPLIETVELHELVSDFATVFEEFCPRAIKPLHTLLELYLRNGRAMLDKTALAGIFESMLEEATSRTKAKRVAANIVIATEFLCTPARQVLNHVSVIEAWTLAATQILRMAKSMSLGPSYWRSSFDLCRLAIEDASEGLATECKLKDKFEEGDAVLDSFFRPYRFTIILGFLAAFVNALACRGQANSTHTEMLLGLLPRVLPMAAWGEGAWNFQLNLVLALRHTAQGVLVGEKIVENWLRFVCPLRPPLAEGPYWSVDDELTRQLEEDEPKPESARVSFTVAPALAVLVRRIRRELVVRLWPDISRFQAATFKPPQDWMNLQWNVEEGATEVHIPPYGQSWTVLRQEAYSQRSTLFSQDELWLLPYFLCTFPHRTTGEFVGELDYRTGTETTRQAWDKRVEELKNLKITVTQL